MTVAPYTAAPRARRPHTIDAERGRFYALQWGEAQGFAYVAAGLPAADILARGWPLAEDETPSNPGELGDKMVMLLWSRATGDAFKAAGRPHTGKVFAWPAEAQALDRYVEKLAGEYDNVFVRKYVVSTEADAKRGNPPALAQVVQVEDAPADPEGLAPPYSYSVQTSEQKRQAYYRFARPQPWHTARALAEAAGLRLQPLGADSGGPNPAQFCRVPTTRNTKERAGRYRVRLLEGAGDVEPAELARAVGVELARPAADNVTLSGAKTRRDPGDLAGDAAAEPWRARSTRDALDALAAPWRPMVRLGRGGLLGDNGAPRGFKGRALENWSGDGTGDGSRDAYHLYTSLLYYGYTDGQALALAEHWAHEHRAGYATKRGAAGVWLDLCRVHFKACARLGDKRRIREAQPPADVTPIPGPELPRARRGRPVGRKADSAERLADALSARVGQLVTRRALAAALGLTPRSITTHLRTLASAGRLDLLPGPRGFTVVRVEIKSCAAPIAAPAHQDTPGAAEGGNKSEGAEGGNYGPAEALQCGAASLGEHAPQLATPCPAPAAGDALDLEALAARIDEAAGTIRAQVSTRIIRRGPRAGLVVETRPRATLEAVAALLPDVPPDALAEAWEYRRSWRRDAERLAAQQNPGELYRELRGVRDALRLADKPAPRPWAELGDDERARLTARKMGRAEGVEARAAALAEAQQREHIRRHRSAVQRRRHNERLERQIAGELRRRGLPLEAPTSRASVGKRAKAPSRDDVRRAEAEQQAECLEAIDRLMARARAEAPPATRRPRVELRRAEAPPAALVALDSEQAAAAFATSADTAVTPLDPGPPADGAPHPAEVAEVPAAAPAAPSAAAGLADRLRVVAARPRVQVAGRGPQVEPVPARARGYSADECEAWLLASGWQRGPGGEWLQPLAKLATAAD